ncbi:MAG TPA: hypothetical protein PK040_02040 [Anaerolineaceae bacterium]|nr:hypothetical protein [Anaerolineaceae bacterium]
MDELKIWRCGKGHALGVVRRNGRGVEQLLLYRHAIAGGSSEQVDVMAVVEGSVMDIRCDICGEMRTWAIGQAAFERLMSHYGKSSSTDNTEKNKTRTTTKLNEKH